MEVTTLERVRVAANQGNIAFLAQAHAKDARDDFYAATNALNSLCQCEAESDFDSTSKDDDKDDDEREEFVGAKGVQGVRAQQKKKVKIDCGPQHSLRITSSASVWSGWHSTQPRYCFPESSNERQFSCPAQGNRHLLLYSREHI
jgi:hypothetical protein